MKRRPVSLTLRLTLLFGMVAAIVFSGFGWFIEHSIERHFKSGDIDELKIVTDHVLQTLTTNEENSEALKQRLNDLLVGHHGAVLQIVAQNGRLFFSSVDDPEFSYMATTALTNNEINSVSRWSSTTHTYRVLISTMGNGASANNNFYTIYVAVAIDHHLTFLNNFRHTLWLMIASGFVVMGLMGWLAVQLGYAPLYTIVRQIRKISVNELNTRLFPKKVPRELSELADSFNEHLQRMEESFAQLSNFSADIAHELRTPVTNLMTQTQVALSKTRNQEEYQEILYSNMEEYEHLSQMIGDMLFLAKADNGLILPNSEVINLKNELGKLCDYYGLLAEEKKISLMLEGSAKVFGDRLMLQRALSNLISNAIRYTTKGETININISEDKNTVLIEVKNPGTRISEEHLSKLFDRFYRTDPSRQHNGEGVGLGLAIVKSIIEAHSGNIVAISDTESTRFQISLPVSNKSAQLHLKS